MKVSSKLRASLVVLLSTMGTAVALLPEDWIEQRFGLSPDGGNGLAEFLWVAAPFILAAVLALSLLRDHYRATARL